MKKIPTLFQRDVGGKWHVIYNQVTLGCEWVLAGEGIATEKMDGTCCAIIDGVLYRRLEVKGGRRPPADFIPAGDYDGITGDVPGWVRVTDGPDDQYHREAWENGKDWALANIDADKLPDGTYELLGPKVQGNPHGLSHHAFHKHGDIVITDAPRDFEGLREYLAVHEIEGIVWSHGDGRMCKLKRRDFGFEWPVALYHWPSFEIRHEDGRRVKATRK